MLGVNFRGDDSGRFDILKTHPAVTAVPLLPNCFTVVESNFKIDGEKKISLATENHNGAITRTFGGI